VLRAGAGSQGSGAAGGQAPGEERRLGVLGWPVAHSRSPQIHNAALRAVGLERWRYQLLPVPPPLLEPTVRALGAAGFRGANVTIPHKAAGARIADELSEPARQIGAVNTLLLEPDGRISAENTDAPGLIAALPSSPRGKTALVLGAGGSARAAAWALLDAGAAEVLVWNRTPARAQELSAQIGAKPVAAPLPADLLVNCTPAGMNAGVPSPHAPPHAQSAGAQARSARLQARSTGVLSPSASAHDLKPLPIQADEVSMFGCVVDFAYAPAETPLIRAARRAGMPVVDGWELLVQQAALSFERFTGLRAPADVMRAAARGS
jgi:shikimate dehydrogenase